jgi:autotransporter-associated beta strand protein
MHSAPIRPVRCALACTFGLLFSVSAARAQTVWSSNPADNLWSTAANWSTGTVPGGTSVTAEFGASSTTYIVVNFRANLGTLQFDATATTPYTLAFTSSGTSSSSTRIGTIVNDSSWAPTLLFQSSYITQNGGSSLADANLIINNSSFYFSGLGGTAAITVNGGSTFYYNRASDGQNARLVLDGLLYATSGSDIYTYTFGSLEGTGTVDLSASNSLTVGGNNRDATFSGAIHYGAATSVITKTGTGTWTLTGTNNSAATVAVTGGALAIDTDARLGTGGAVTLAGGSLCYAAAFDDLRAVVLGGSGGSLDTQGCSVTHSAGISGSGSLTKLGSGSLTLGAANTYSGGSTLSAGSLVVGHDAALGSGALHLAGGTLAASGTRTLANAVTLDADTTIGGSSALTFNGAWTLAGNHNLTVANSAATKIAGTIGESGGPRALLKYGSGTLVLTGANTYTGGTLIAEGTVKINNSTGSAFGTGAVTVAAGATLAGSGSFTGALQLNGTLAPGNSPGTLTAGDTTFAGGGTYQWQLNDAAGSAGTNWDLLAVNGTLTLSATSANPFTLDLTSLTLADATGDAANFNAASDYSFTFLTTTNGVSGFLSDAFAIDTTHFTNPFSGTWSVSLTNSGHDLSLHYTASAVPEPSTCAMIAGLAALGLATLRRRRAPGLAAWCRRVVR